MELSPGTRLDSFEVVSRLGEGGMGAVYRARDRELDREVAIKILHKELGEDPDRIERFKREARAASALSHPNIVTIYEIGAGAMGLYLVMELVRGRTLRSRMDDGVMSMEELTSLAAQLAEGLAKAHEAGIVHRDLKPENVMVTTDGIVKILDFGLAKLLTARDPPAEISSTSTMEQKITKPGIVVGTVAYMSPEQIAGQAVNVASDQFSLGVILYEMATGRHPFLRGSSQQTLTAILKDPPEPMTLHRPELPSLWFQIVEQLLSKRAEDRYGSTSELAAELRTGEKSVRRTEPAFLRASPGEERIRPLFVGREKELTRLTKLVERSTERSGQLAVVTGEAGSGKTSLIWELMHRAQDHHDDLIVAFGNCDAQTGIGDPYLPFREILALLTGDVEARRAAGAISLDHARRLWNFMPRVMDVLRRAAPELVDTLIPGEALASRTGTRPRPSPGPPVQQSALFEQCTQLLLELSRHRPLLLVLEDLHWADPGTVGLLFHLCRRLPGHSVLVVGSYRPVELRGDARHPLGPVLHELQSNFGELEVALDEAAGRLFVDAVVDSHPNRLGSDFREGLFRQTQGHPLFTVELLHALRSKGMLEVDPEGKTIAGESLDWDTLPARIEAVIAERIERLPERLQRILRLGSVEGEEFTAEVVARVEGIEDRELVRILSDELDKRHRLLGAHDSKHVGDQRLSIYRFRHILFQKYLYQRFDRVERSYLHESVGTTLEKLLSDRAGEWAVQLARHFEEAGLSAKAIDYLRQAGERAMRLAANEQASEHFVKALDMLASLPESEARDSRELDLQLALGTALQPVRGFSSAECQRAFARASELFRTADPTPGEMPALWGLWMYHLQNYHRKASWELAERFMQLAERTSDRGVELQALHVVWTEAFFRGELEETMRAVERGHNLYDKDEHHSMTYSYGNHDPDVCCLAFAGVTSALRGEPKRSVATFEQAISMARMMAHPPSEALARVLRAIASQINGDVDAALSEAEWVIAGGKGSFHATFVPFARAVKGWALGRQEGALEEAEREFREANVTMIMKAYSEGLQAATYLDRGLPERAEEMLDETISWMEEFGYGFYSAEIYRLKGAVLTKRARERAESYFRKAIDVARRQTTRALELRAVTSLARLRREGDSRVALDEICSRFTDGYESPHLKEARDLLVELADET